MKWAWRVSMAGATAELLGASHSHASCSCKPPAAPVPAHAWHPRRLNAHPPPMQQRMVACSAGRAATVGVEKSSKNTKASRASPAADEHEPRVRSGRQASHRQANNLQPVAQVSAHGGQPEVPGAAQVHDHQHDHGLLQAPQPAPQPTGSASVTVASTDMVSEGAASSEQASMAVAAATARQQPKLQPQKAAVEHDSSMAAGMRQGAAGTESARPAPAPGSAVTVGTEEAGAGANVQPRPGALAIATATANAIFV